MAARFNWVCLLLGLVLAACGPRGFQSSEVGLEEEPVMLEEVLANDDLASRAELSPSIYFHPLIRDEENNCKTEKWTSLRGKGGVELMKVCSTTLKICAMEGSCQVQRAGKIRSFNYQGTSNGHYVFFEIPKDGCVFGYGVGSVCLDPFHTVAADLSVWKPGSVIYIPKVLGAKLPNGEIHSGFFIVRDTGEAIKGPHRFDFFTGSLHWNDPRNPFRALSLADTDQKLTYYRVQGETALRIRKERAYPRFPESPRHSPALFSFEGPGLDLGLLSPTN